MLAGRSRFSHIFVCVFWGVFLNAIGGAQIESPRVRGEDYPRVFFFRQAEGAAANQRIPYDRWEKTFERLMGIEGKVLEEEVPGRSIRNVDFFTRFKKNHPDQLVLLHINGNARDPRYECERFFAGHWLYFDGAKILSDVAAEEGMSEIRVSDASLFKTAMGRYRTSNEDIGLCALDKAGKPDWRVSEQVQLVSVDAAKNIIRVRRGCYGTKPLAFSAGKAYAAAHASEGPWGGKSNILWLYNYSTRCPRDSKGQTCSDVFVEHLGELFGAGGELEAFDGLEFDVLHNTCRGARARGADCDADGTADNGIFDGINAYGIGVVEFCRKLREKLGEDVIILADGHSVSGQRAFGILNGIESEGWPDLRDHEIADWSGGLNRHFFWDVNGRKPVFNYINHKYTMAGEKPGQRIRPDVPFSSHRLVFAAGVFTDSAMCYSFTPENDAGGLIGIWDEFRMGKDNRLGWLGQPSGPAVRMAKSSPDMLEGTQSLIERFGGGGLEFSRDHKGIKISAEEAQVSRMRFRLADVPCDGQDLFVSVTAQAEGMEDYPTEYARLMYVGVAADKGQLVSGELPETGMRLRGEGERALDAGSGGSLRYQQNVAIQGQRHNAYLVHPPYKGGRVGYTFWRREVSVAGRAKLDFYLGMGAKSPERSDGVLFIVQIADANGGRFQEVFRHLQKAHVWSHHVVDLSRWANRKVVLKFISDCGENDNSTTDHSYWGDVFVLGPGGREGMSRPVRYMTWVNERDFTSGFYFSDIRSETVDLEFMIEGREPVYISDITVHGHPDAMYRRFEKGMVLANPSPRPYTFDMKKLFGNVKFRRLKATANQDTKTNSGKPVGESLTLEPKEGLFLVEHKNR